MPELEELKPSYDKISELVEELSTTVSDEFEDSVENSFHSSILQDTLDAAIENVKSKVSEIEDQVGSNFRNEMIAIKAKIVAFKLVSEQLIEHVSSLDDDIEQARKELELAVEKLQLKVNNDLA